MTQQLPSNPQPIGTMAEAYAAWTITTATYPRSFNDLTGNSAVSVGVLYTALGLGNEVGELAEQFDIRAGEYNVERYVKAWKELGDVQWYTARLCAELEGAVPSFEALVGEAYALLYAQEFRTARLTGYELQSKLCVHSGVVLGVVKKMMRDGFTWDEAKRSAKMAELHNALLEIIAASVEYAERTGPLVGTEGGYEKLLTDNRDKLMDRAARGVLQGDGGER